MFTAGLGGGWLLWTARQSAATRCSETGYYHRTHAKIMLLSHSELISDVLALGCP
ncbi:hypothetical protein VFPFJ_09671 [Purpureocillium lilacinum]|uniref:Uncharacterized protein n=1 Tax=Purpureocillium lilacinum TaxID=33203 RepID=A0A179GTE3_PURLI|nr:hypothetical protein VFPFJ_09671 [Purpureocillium lilacinum]OAQ75590.1 hypothetical protein VFPBJ_09563 [Purpureocillium lilacinum]OAQ81216.1 hypothetical protein VFPFJ_09671 [Purpureocillium lilacinum]